MKIFIDTAPFIYFIENHGEFGPKVEKYFTEKLSQGDHLITSVMTIMEFGVKPAKEGKNDLNQRFEEFLERIGVEVVEITKVMAKKAYHMRAKYPALKAMDSLQISAAFIENCDSFFTNDIKLKQIEELHVVLLKEVE